MKEKQIENFINKTYDKGLKKTMPLYTFREIERVFKDIKQYGNAFTLNSDVMEFYKKYDCKIELWDTNYRIYAQ